MANPYLMAPQLNFVDTSSKIRFNFLIRSRWNRWGPDELRSWLRTSLLSIQYHEADQDSWSIPTIVRDVEKKSKPTDEDMMFQPLLPSSWEQAGCFTVTRAQITKVARMMPSFRADLEGFLSDFESELYVSASVPNPSTGEPNTRLFLRGTEPQTQAAPAPTFTFSTGTSQTPNVFGSSVFSFRNGSSVPPLFNFGCTTNPPTPFGVAVGSNPPLLSGNSQPLQPVQTTKRPQGPQLQSVPAKKARISNSSPGTIRPNSLPANNDSELKALKAQYESLKAENESLRMKLDKSSNEPAVKKEGKELKTEP